MHRCPRSDSAATWWRQRPWVSGQPCMNSTGTPSSGPSTNTSSPTPPSPCTRMARTLLPTTLRPHEPPCLPRGDLVAVTPLRHWREHLPPPGADADADDLDL